MRLPFLVAILLVLARFHSKAATLDDLKKLETICFVPSYLPEGFKLEKVEITYDEIQEYEDKNHPLPLYSLEYGDSGKRTFSIESAREGIGDRNIMEEEEDTEETELKTPLGPMYLIYRPKGKEGPKIEILTSWVEDEQMKADQAKSTTWHGELGRFHGFTGENISLAEFQKILDSLHPIKGDKSTSSKPKETGGAPELKLHPKIFNMIVLDSKGSHYKVEYQENGGGTLTTASIIEFDIQKRNIQRGGKTASIRVLRVTSYSEKK